MARTETVQKQLSHRIPVLIKRDQLEQTPRVIWEHEKPILEMIFGEGNVTDIDPKTMDEGYREKFTPAMLIHNKTQDTVPRPSTSQGIGFVFTGSPEVEYDRLADVYGRHKDENVLLVEKVYGRLQRGTFKELVGTPSLSDLPAPQLRSLITDYGYAQEPHKDAAADEKNAVYAQRKELAVMPIDGLVKVAKELDIQLG